MPQIHLLVALLLLTIAPSTVIAQTDPEIVGTIAGEMLLKDGLHEHACNAYLAVWRSQLGNKDRFGLVRTAEKLYEISKFHPAAIDEPLAYLRVLEGRVLAQPLPEKRKGPVPAIEHVAEEYVEIARVINRGNECVDFRDRLVAMGEVHRHSVRFFTASLTGELYAARRYGDISEAVEDFEIRAMELIFEFYLYRSSLEDQLKIAESWLQETAPVSEEKIAESKAIRVEVIAALQKPCLPSLIQTFESMIRDGRGVDAITLIKTYTRGHAAVGLFPALRDAARRTEDASVLQSLDKLEQATTIHPMRLPATNPK